MTPRSETESKPSAVQRTDRRRRGRGESGGWPRCLHLPELIRSAFSSFNFSTPRRPSRFLCVSCSKFGGVSAHRGVSGGGQLPITFNFSASLIGRTLR